MRKVFLQFANIFERLTRWLNSELLFFPAGLCGCAFQYKQQHICKCLQFHQCQACLDLRSTRAIWYHSLHANLWVEFYCAGQLVSNASSLFENERYLSYLSPVLTLPWDPSQEYLIAHNLPHCQTRHGRCAAYFCCCPSCRIYYNDDTCSLCTGVWHPWLH